MRCTRGRGDSSASCISSYTGQNSGHLVSDLRSQLQAIVHPVATEQAHVFVREQLTVYRDMVKHYAPHVPTKKKLSGLEVHIDEDDEQPTKTKRGQSSNREQNQLDSMRKAVNKVKDYAKWNQFELFATFTFDPDKVNRQSADQCFAKITNWFKNEQKRKGKLEYVIVPEYHKDGVSFHFHALIKGYKGELRPSISPKTGKQIREKGRLVYELPSYTAGYTNVKIIGDTIEDQTRTGNYVAKYITKSLIDFSGKQRYRVSNGLELPPKVDNPEPGWNKDLKLVWSQPNDFGTTSYYKSKEVEQ